MEKGWQVYFWEGNNKHHSQSFPVGVPMNILVTCFDVFYKTAIVAEGEKNNNQWHTWIADIYNN